MEKIPIRNLKERGNVNFELGRIELGSHNLFQFSSHAKHRDDYYIFIYQETGTTSIVVDFNHYTMAGNTLFCIQPGQIHFGDFSSDTNSWIIAVTAEWIPFEIRLALMENKAANAPVPITAAKTKQLFTSTFLLLQKFEEQKAQLPEKTIQSMFYVCLTLFNQEFEALSNTVDRKNTRAILLTRQFRSLLLTHFKIMKTPAEYVESLHITPAYLNEVVKDTTGYPVSY